MNKVIKFIDLSLRPSILNYKINITIKKNIKNNNFIMGEDVYHLESKLKKICNVNYVVTCSSGTDALVMSLMSLYIKKDDIVFVPSFTFTSTAESVVLVGGRPFFVDVLSGSFNINPVSLENGIKKAKNSFFLYPNQNDSDMSSPVFLIRPVSLTFDSYIDFRKAFPKENR